MSCQSPCKRVGWVGAVIKVQSAQEQSRASGSSSLLCLRAYHKKTQKGEESSVCRVPQCSLEIGRPEEGHSSTEKAQLQSSYSHCCRGDRRQTDRSTGFRAARPLFAGMATRHSICKALGSCHKQQTNTPATQEAGKCFSFCFFLSESSLKHHCYTIFPIKNVP